MHFILTIVEFYRHYLGKMENILILAHKIFKINDNRHSKGNKI